MSFYDSLSGSVSTSGLASYWSLNNSAANEVTLVTGTLGAATTFSTSFFSSDATNQAAVFNGTTGSIISTTEAATLATNVFTVAAWVNTNTIAAGSAAIIDCYNNISGNQYGFVFQRSGAQVGLAMCAGSTGSTVCWGTTSLVVGKWYFVVSTYDGTNIKTYINGVLEKTTSAINALKYYSSNYTKIGGYAYSLGTLAGPWNGKIDEISFWNTALSATDVKSLYGAYNEIFSGGITANQTLVSGGLTSYNNTFASDNSNINTAVVSADLTTSIKLKGNISDASIDSGLITTGIRLSTNTSGSSTSTGQLVDGVYAPSVVGTFSNNLKGYWRLDNDAANDIGLASGTLGSTTSFGNGIFSALDSNRSAVFDGTANSSISLPDSGSLTSSIFTVSFWVNPNSYATQPTVFSNYYYNGASSAYGWEVYINSSGKATFGMAAGGGITGLVSSTTTMTAGKWNYVVATYDGATTKIYINGKLEASTSYSGGFSVAVQTFGRIGSYRGPSADAGVLSGKIDEVAYWSKVLSASEINSLYGIYAGISGAAQAKSPSLTSGYLKNYDTTLAGNITASGSVASTNITTNIKLSGSTADASTDSGALITGIKLTTSSSASATLSGSLIDTPAGFSNLISNFSNNLKHYWSFDQTAQDFFGNLNVLTGVPGYNSGIAGGWGIAASELSPLLVRLGSAGYATDLIDSTSTLSMWIKPTSSSRGYNEIIYTIGTANYSTTNGLYIVVTPQNTISLVVRGVAVFNIAVNFNGGQWKHVVVTRNNNDYNLYTDGNYAGGGTASGSPILQQYAPTGFSAFDTTAKSFSGTIDEIAYWDSSLTSTQINDLYLSYLTKLSASISGSSNVSANLRIGVKLEGNSQIFSDVVWLDGYGPVNGELTTNIKLSGSVSEQASVSSGLTTGIVLTAGEYASAVLEGELNTQISIYSNVNATSVAVASLTTNTGSNNPGNNGGSKIMSNPLKILTQLTASKLASFKEGLDVNSQKITSLADGTVSSDAVNLGQLTGLSSSMKSYVDAADTTLQGNLDAVSGAMKSYVDAQNAAQDAASQSVSGAMKAYVDAQNSAQDVATAAISSSIVSYVDAENAAQDAATSALSSSMAAKIDAVDSAQTAANSALSSSLKGYVDAADAAQDAATAALSSSIKGYVDAANNAQDAATAALSSSLVSKIDAADTQLQSNLDAVSGALKSYVDAADSQLQTNLDTVSGSLKSYVDSQNAAQDSATSALSSSIKSYVDAANGAQDAATAALSSSIISYVDAADTVLQGNLDSVSGAMKSYVDAQNSAQDSATAAMSSSIKGYVDAANSAQDAATSALSSSISSSIAAEAQARADEDLTFLKLDGSRSMQGALNMGGQDIVSAKSGSFSGDLTVGGNLTVNGQLTYINSTNLDVTDKLITIAKGAANGAAADGAGLQVDGAGVSFVYDNAAGKWVSDIGLSVAGEASFDGAMKLSGSAFENITTPVVSGKFDVSDAIHALDLKVGANAVSLSDKYDALRLVVTGTLSSGTVTVDLSTEGGAQFVTAEMANIALDVMVDADNTGYTNDLVAIKMFTDAGALKVQIDAPATPTAKFRLIAVNEKDGGLA